MARISKSGLDYFPLDVNFLQDRKVRRISSRHHAAGIAALTSLFCLIYKEKGYYVPWNQDTLFDVAQEACCEEAEMQAIIDDCLVLAAGKKHPFYRRGRIHVQELNNQKFAVREYGSGTRQLFEDYTLRHDLKILTAWEAHSPQALLNAVLYNQMLSVMSIRLMHHEIRHRSVRVFCNEAGEWNRKFKLVYHKNKFLTPAIFELEKILHTYQQLELPSVMGVLEQE